MKPKLFFILIMFAADSLRAAGVLCINNREFKIPEIARRLTIEASFRVKFDIINFEPQKIEMFPIDSLSALSLPLFNSTNIENIKNIVYLKDTLNYELIMRYKSKPTRTLNRDYAEINSDSELIIIFPRIGISTSKYIDLWKFAPNADSLCFEDLIPYSGGSHYPANILVERIFNGESDSSYIRFNNYPELEAVILKEAKEYSKDIFISQIRGEQSRPGQRFFIRFRLRRNIPQCECDEEF